MVVTTTIRKKSRSASVPVDYEEPSFDDSPMHAHRSRLIANAVINDTDALSTASRRHDQELMRDINARLAHSAISRPSPPPIRRNVHNKPPVPTHKYSQPLTVSKSALAAIMSNDTPSSDREVDLEVERMMPITTRTLRAGSVPPAMSRAALMSEMSPPTIRKTKVIRNGPVGPIQVLNGPGSYTAYVEPTVVTRHGVEHVIPAENYYYFPQSAARLTPTADLAVREAHRNLDRIDHELRSDASLVPPPSPRPYVRTYATLDSGPRSSSYHGSRTDLRTRSPSPVYSSTVSSGPPLYSYSTGSSVPFYRTTSYDLSYPGDTHVVQTSRKYVSTNSPDILTSYPTTSVVGVRPYSGMTSYTPSSTSDIEAMIRSARTLPDVSSSSYQNPSTSSYVPPSSGSTSSAGLPPSASKSKVSATRQRVRDVLCRVKKDPHYFD